MDAQVFINDAANMPLNELERFVQELNALIARRKVTDSQYRERFLLGKINQAVLSAEQIQRYRLLVTKLEEGTISESEHAEFITLADAEEKVRFERLTYLVELAQLKNISVPQLMSNLGFNTNN